MCKHNKALIELKKDLIFRIKSGINRGDIKRNEAEEAIKTLVLLTEIELKIESEDK